MLTPDDKAVRQPRIAASALPWLMAAKDREVLRLFRQLTLPTRKQRRKMKARKS